MLIENIKDEEKARLIKEVLLKEKLDDMDLSVIETLQAHKNRSARVRTRQNKELKKANGMKFITVELTPEQLLAIRAYKGKNYADCIYKMIKKHCKV